MFGWKKKQIEPEPSSTNEKIMISFESHSKSKLRMTEKLYTADYNTPAVIECMHEEVQKHMMALCAKEIDEGNIDALFAMCSDMARLGINSIKEQYVYRTRMIDSIFLGCESRQLMLQKRVDENTEKLKNIQDEITEIRNRIKTDKFRAVRSDSNEKKVGNK